MDTQFLIKKKHSWGHSYRFKNTPTLTGDFHKLELFDKQILQTRSKFSSKQLTIKYTSTSMLRTHATSYTPNQTDNTHINTLAKILALS